MSKGEREKAGPRSEGEGNVKAEGGAMERVEEGEA